MLQSKDGSGPAAVELTRPWVVFFEQLVGAVQGIGGNSEVISNSAGTWTEETPAGAMDGANKAFTLSHTPIADTLALYLNGVEQVEGVDFTISGAAIAMTIALKFRDTGYWRAKYAY